MRAPHKLEASDKMAPKYKNPHGTISRSARNYTDQEIVFKRREIFTSLTGIYAISLKCLTHTISGPDSVLRLIDLRGLFFNYTLLSSI